MNCTAAALLTPQSVSSRPLTVSPPHVVNGDVIYGGATDTHPWKRRPQPAAGVQELRWFHENLAQLAGYENRWVALLGQQIVAYGGSIEEVHGELHRRGIYDALVVLVPADVERREYFIG